MNLILIMIMLTDLPAPITASPYPCAPPIEVLTLTPTSFGLWLSCYTYDVGFYAATLT